MKPIRLVDISRQLSGDAPVVGSFVKVPLGAINRQRERFPYAQHLHGFAVEDAQAVIALRAPKGEMEVGAVALIQSSLLTETLPLCVNTHATKHFLVTMFLHPTRDVVIAPEGIILPREEEKTVELDRMVESSLDEGYLEIDLRNSSPSHRNPVVEKVDVSALQNGSESTEVGMLINVDEEVGIRMQCLHQTFQLRRIGKSRYEVGKLHHFFFSFIVSRSSIMRSM